MENNLIQQSFFYSYDFPFQFNSLGTSDFDQFYPNSKDAEGRKSRGRKKLRPGNPLKTEVLDKYWLRSFKNFLKSEFLSIKHHLKDNEFWNWYLLQGRPGKNTVFLSYNANYKKRLFENQEYCALFVAWGMTLGTLKVPVKTLKAPWEFYYQYLYQELIPRSFNLAFFEDIKEYHDFICGTILKLTENNPQQTIAH